MLLSVLSDTYMYITVVKFSPSACARAACADDDDEIILGIIALVVVKAE